MTTGTGLQAGATRALGDRLAATGLALLVGIGFLVEGYDDLFGGDIVCIGASAILVLLLAARAPGLAFWRATAVPMLLLLAGLAWAVAGSVPGAGGRALAPDLLPSSLAARWGGLTVLLSGAILGARRVALTRFVYPLLASGLAGLVLGLLLRDLGGGDTWLLWSRRNESRFLGTLGNANVAAAVYGSLAVLAFAAALDALPRTRPAAVLLLGALAALGAEVLTASRTGTLLTLAALLLVALAMPFRRRKVWLAGGGLLLVLAVVLSADLLAERAQRIGDDIGVRPMMWRHYGSIAADSPWRGHGMGTFGTLNTRHLDTVTLGEALWTVNAPHDIWLALVLEGGLPWLLLTLLAIVLIAWRIVAGLRRPVRRLDVGAAGVLLIVLGLASVDIAFEIPAVSALALVLAGWLWGRALPSDAVRVQRPNRVPAREQVAIGG